MLRFTSIFKISSFSNSNKHFFLYNENVNAATQGCIKHIIKTIRTGPHHLIKYMLYHYLIIGIFFQLFDIL